MILRRKKVALSQETGRLPPIGYAQRRFLQLLKRLGPNDEPSDRTFSARGVMRDRVANDCVGSHLASIEQLPDGSNRYRLTSLGRAVLKAGKVSKAPPKGYRKVPGRTAARMAREAGQSAHQ